MRPRTPYYSPGWELVTSLLRFLGTILAIIAVIVGLVGFIAITGTESCDNRFADFPHRWELIGGCMVRDDDGRWIPDENFRVID